MTTVQNLITQILAEHPEARLEFEPMPSGICWLNVWIDDRGFELEFDPKHGAGVTEINDDTPAFTAHDREFPSLDQAAPYFQQLLSSAENSSARATLTEQVH